jgi:hypothetical protein
MLNLSWNGMQANEPSAENLKQNITGPKREIKNC